MLTRVQAKGKFKEKHQEASDYQKQDSLQVNKSAKGPNSSLLT